MNKIVVGLGFGDEGKGHVTDWLCSQSKNSIVVRFNGGQQAGHTVMMDDKKHVFSNYGSGTLRGVPTYFTEHCSIYLNTMAVELTVLQGMGINPKLYVHPLTKVTTPYDVAWNRATEKMNRHGSCGLGIAATMKRHNESPYKLFAIDFTHPEMFASKLANIHYKYYLDKLNDLEKSQVAEYNDYVSKNLGIFMENIQKKMFKTWDYSLLDQFTDRIWEGAQGILLDKDHGVFPNVTYSNTTSRNAVELIEKLKLGGTTEVFYVTRCYTTRHGNGWAPNKPYIKLVNTEHEINVVNEWQTNFRIFDIDYDLINYSLELDGAYNPYPANLVVTCLDQRPDFKFDYDKIKLKEIPYYESYSPYSDQIQEVKYEDVDIPA